MYAMHAMRPKIVDWLASDVLFWPRVRAHRIRYSLLLRQFAPGDVLGRAIPWVDILAIKEPIYVLQEDGKRPNATIQSVSHPHRYRIARGKYVRCSTRTRILKVESHMGQTARKPGAADNKASAIKTTQPNTERCMPRTSSPDTCTRAQ